MILCLCWRGLAPPPKETKQMKEILKPLFFLVLSVVGLVVAVTTQDETIKTLLGAPAFVGILFAGPVLLFEI